ncbi:MAG: restriction endonuclease subunit S [Lachnospiraceae bacterium]
MSNIPKIRFKGFTEEWEQRKFSELYVRSSEKNDGSIGMDRNITVATMQFKEDVKVSTVEYLKTYYTFNLGDIAFEGHQSKEFRYGRFVENDIGNGIVSHIFAVFSPIKEFDLQFWKYAINNEILMQRILSRSTKASTMMHDLVTEDFLNETFLVPSLDEQKQIGAYLKSLDHLITLHQRKYDEITELKKYMLKKMFPAKGKNTPEIRFTGFTEDWEQRKLGEIIEKLTGGTSIAPDDYVESGYRTIPKGAINNSGIADMSGCKNVSEEFFVKNISSKTSTGELVTSLRDLVPTAPNMGRIVRICGDSEEFLMPQGVYSIVVKNNISEDFLITYSNSSEYRKIIMAEKNGSTQVHIRNGEFLNIDIPLPSYEEQKKVGSYFAAIDHLLTLHQQKLDELTELKKYMLQNMFPKKEG